jgi:hypothetical protein
MIDNLVKKLNGAAKSLPRRTASSDGIGDSPGDTGWDIWTATRSSSHARSQSEKMINLNPRGSAGPCLGRRQRMGSVAHSNATIPFARAGSNSFQRLHCRIHWRSPESRPPAPRDVRTILRKSLRRWCSWCPTSRLNSFTAQGMLPTVSRRTLSCRLVDFAAPNPVQAQRAQFMASSGASI